MSLTAHQFADITTHCKRSHLNTLLNLNTTSVLVSNRSKRENTENISLTPSSVSSSDWTFFIVYDDPYYNKQLFLLCIQGLNALCMLPLWNIFMALKEIAKNDKYKKDVTVLVTRSWIKVPRRQEVYTAKRKGRTGRNSSPCYTLSQSQG